jgi:imidazole glycerol-phosphate synthase subunit HisF
MKRFRIIPTLLIEEGKLVKTINFKNSCYVGDPINAVKIFNEKEVDEISIIDISITKNKIKPNYKLLSDIAGEAFMPFSYGGGISSIEIGKEIISCGVEKLIINDAFLKNVDLVKDFKDNFGSQSIVASVDLKKTWFGKYGIFNHVSKKVTKLDIYSYIKSLEKNGIGELLLNYVDNDGTFKGYNINHCQYISKNLDIPVILAGGCNGIKNMYEALKFGKASALSVGAFFIYQLPHRAVMINYPNQNELMKNIYTKF